MIEPRPYQTEAVQAIASGYRRGVRRPLVGLPTGTGKTVIFSMVTQGAVAKGNRALILAHRDELISQAVDKLGQVAPELALSIGIVKADLDEHRLPVTVASVQSLHPKRLDRVIDYGGERPYEIVVVDEAHHAVAASYVRILERLGCLSVDGPLTLGVTATPQRADGKGLGDVWQEIVYHRDILGMIQAGYLCNLRGVRVKLAAFDDSKLHTRAGDFKQDEAGEMLLDADAPRHAVNAWLVHAKARRTIVFTPTVEVAREMAAEFASRGVDAEWVSGQTPTLERRAILQRFEAGTTQVVCNCAVLTEGFDSPATDCVVVARPTKSQLLYIQMVGRGTRLFPGKPDCLVLDVVGATERHDLTTLAKLFKLDEGGEGADPGEVNVSEQLRIKQAREIREGRIVAEQVNLFGRQDFNWRMLRPGVWSLALGDEVAVLDVGPDSKWRAVVYPKGAEAVTVAGGVDLSMAMGVAEERARKGNMTALVDKRAPWRNKPVTPGQVEALAKWQRTPHEGMTRGEANDMLAQLIALSRIRRAAR